MSIKITIKDIIAITMTVASILGFYFALEKRITILELELKYIKDNQRVWIKQSEFFK